MHRPIPVPDEYLYEGMERITLGAPPGMEDRVYPLELLRDDENHEFWVLIELKPEDIERGKVWFIVCGDGFPPISTATAYKKGELEGEIRDTSG